MFKTAAQGKPWLNNIKKFAKFSDLDDKLLIKVNKIKNMTMLSMPYLNA